MSNRRFIILVREHIDFEHWFYTEYKSGIVVNRYSVEQVEELMKNNDVIII